MEAMQFQPRRCGERNGMDSRHADALQKEKEKCAFYHVTLCSLFTFGFNLLEVCELDEMYLFMCVFNSVLVPVESGRERHQNAQGSVCFGNMSLASQQTFIFIYLF